MSESARNDQQFTEEEIKAWSEGRHKHLEEQLETARQQGLAWRSDFENARKIIKMQEEHISTLSMGIKAIAKLAEKSGCDC